MDECIFDKIIKGEIPSYKVWENEDFLAFLSIRPINLGHTLVIPKKHVPYFWEMDDKLLSRILLVSKPLAEALKKAFNPKTGRIGVMIAGGEVPHAHLHLIPMDSEGDLTFARAKVVSPENLAQNQKKILAALAT